MNNGENVKKEFIKIEQFVLDSLRKEFNKVNGEIAKKKKESKGQDKCE